MRGEQSSSPAAVLSMARTRSVIEPVAVPLP